MAHADFSSLKGQADSTAKEKLHRVTGGVHEDEARDKEMVEKAILEHEEHDHPGKPHTRIKLKSGGVAEGPEAKERHDRVSKKDREHFARGGAPKGGGKKGTHINVIVAPGAGAPARPPMPMAGMGAPPPVAAPPVAPPRPPMTPPPGAGMPAGGMGALGGMPPGMGRKAGGRLVGGNNGVGHIAKMKNQKGAPEGENKPSVEDYEGMGKSRVESLESRKRGGGC